MTLDATQNANINSGSTVKDVHTEQIITHDYTGVCLLSGTVFIISMITLAVINKISEKWRIDHYKIKQMEVNKACEQNIILLRKLDKVLDVLNKEVTEECNM